MSNSKRRLPFAAMASNAKWCYGLHIDKRELINSSTPPKDFKPKNLRHPVLAQRYQTKNKGGNL